MTCIRPSRKAIPVLFGRLKFVTFAVRLRINKIEPFAIVDIAETQRKKIDFLKSTGLSYGVKMRCIMCVQCKNPDFDGYFTTYMAHPLEFDPLTNGNIDRRTVLSFVVSWIQAINDTARGKRPDLYKIITGK